MSKLLEYLKVLVYLMWMPLIVMVMLIMHIYYTAGD